MNAAAADFAWWAGTAALGLDAPGRLEAVLPVAVERGVLARRLGGDPAAVLLAWPSRAGGLMGCIRMGRDGAANDFVVAWPFAATGIAHRMTVHAVHADEDCDALRLLTGSVAGTVLTVFDGGAFSDAAVDATIDVRVHGWAARLEPASVEPIRLHPDTVGDDMRATFRDAFAREGELVMRTDRLVALFPTRDGPSPLFELRTPVRAVRPGLALPGMQAWVLTVAIARPDDGDDMLDIEMTVTDAVWAGAPPQVGQSVQGLVWLQAVAA